MEKLKALKAKLSEEGASSKYEINTYMLARHTLIPLLEEVYQEIESLKDLRKEGR